jgi:hypothetical protein
MTKGSLDEKHYVPVVKWKRGEQSAFKDLTPAVKAACTPLIEIVPVGFDYKKQVAKKTLEEHLIDGIAAIPKSWGLSTIFVDTRLLKEDLTVQGKTPLAFVCDGARAANATVVPVVSIRSRPDVVKAACDANKVDGRGVCVRDLATDVLTPSYAGALNALLLSLNVRASSVDMIVDMQDVPPNKVVMMQTFATTALTKITGLGKWRALVLAATAFPENLSEIRPGIGELERAEWQVWKGLTVPRPPTFSDYPIAHWDWHELDPRVIRISASIRYTADEKWIIFRGRNVNDHGFKQFTSLSKQLVRHPAFSGAAFSAGDSHIDQCAAGGKTGNHETWRRAGTNHHITFVVQQLANRFASSALDAPETGAASA